MPLHRDIHWIGRQWAVTGHGMQLIDQKLQGFFDVEVSRLWDDILIESLQAKEWLNRADFDKGLALARARYPQPPGAETPARQATSAAAVESVAPLAPAVKPIAPKLEAPKLEIPQPAAPPLAKPATVEPPRAALTAPAITTRAPLGSPTTVAPPPQAAPSALPSPSPPAAERDAPERVVFAKPAVVEPLRAVAESPAPAIATNASSVESSPPPTLFQMRYEGRARFVRPWRVMARKI
jgi:hypothetical protein